MKQQSDMISTIQGKEVEGLQARGIPYLREKRKGGSPVGEGDGFQGTYYCQHLLSHYYPRQAFEGVFYTERAGVGAGIEILSGQLLH